MQNSTDLIPGLPDVPSYQEGELIQSHLRRIADANYISLGQLGQMLVGKTLPATELERRQLAERIAEKLGHPSDQVKSLTLPGYLLRQGNKSSRRQVCPECLSQEVTQSALLAEPAYAICPTHGLAHLVKCPACHRQLLWGSGKRHACLCGFDLRKTERVKVSADTLELFRACLEDRALGDLQTMLSVGTQTARMGRLKSALDYLSTSCSEDKSQTRGRQKPMISSAAYQWDNIGIRVGANPMRLSDAVIDIEMQLVYTKTRPGRAVSRPAQTRAAISWAHLRDLAMSAQQRVINLGQTIDIGCIAEMHGLEPQDVLAVQLEASNRISPHLRSEMRSQLGKLKRQRGDNPEWETQRIAALISLVQELRSVHETEWMNRFRVDNKDGLFSFIAAGAIQPWVPVQIENWHVLQSDVERAFRPVSGSSFPDLQRSKKSDFYAVNFLQIFSADVPPAGWLGLSWREIGKRVERLVRMSEWPIGSPECTQNQQAIPLGFCAFIKGEPLLVCGDPKEKRGLDRLVLASESWETAALELEQVCLRAQENFAGLNDLQRVAANVAWDYALGMKNGESEVEAREKANIKMATTEPHPHKAMCAAIEAYEVAEQLLHDQPKGVL